MLLLSMVEKKSMIEIRWCLPMLYVYLTTVCCFNWILILNGSDSWILTWRYWSVPFLLGTCPWSSCIHAADKIRSRYIIIPTQNSSIVSFVSSWFNNIENISWEASTQASSSFQKQCGYWKFSSQLFQVWSPKIYYWLILKWPEIGLNHSISS